VQNQAKLAEPELYVSGPNEGYQRLQCITLGGQGQPILEMPGVALTNMQASS